MKHVICIADWAHDPLLSQEFRTSVEGYAKDPSFVRISYTPSTSSTIHASFLALQTIFTVGRLGRPTETLLFLHCDPRTQNSQDTHTQEGSLFLIAHLANGVYVCAPNAGYVFSFLKTQIEEVFTYTAPDTSPSRLRFRDQFSRVVAHMADYMDTELQLEEAHTSIIPDILSDTYHIGHIDTFATVYTTIPESYLKGKHEPGEYVKVQINHVSKDVRFLPHGFAGHMGELVITPSAFGPIENPFLELSVRGHMHTTDKDSAYMMFHAPRPGDSVEIG